MAHFAVGFLTLSMLVVVLSIPITALLLVLPALMSTAIARWRTVADSQHVTVRTLLGSHSVSWDAITGLGFSRGSWAQAVLADGAHLRLPAVSFATLPLLAQASGGRVPNPYS